MKKLLIVLTTILISTQAFADKPLKWYSFDEGLAKAKVEHKILLVDFYTDWCGWCKKMDAATYENETVKKLLDEKFIAAKLNPEKQGTVTFNGKILLHRQLAKAIQVSGYPTTGFFMNDSVFIGQVSGYFEPKQFIELLNKVVKARDAKKE